MGLNNINQKIIEAVVEKSEKVCPGSLDLIGVYGSVCTGDAHGKSDLDLMIIINDDTGWQLSEAFILEDKKIGYDIYCTSWGMLEDEAACRHAHLAKLMDSKIVYVKNPEVAQKLSGFQAKAEGILKSEKRFECADNLVNEAKRVYADAMIAESIGRVRVCASHCISLLLDAVMLENGQYFHRGVKRTFEELKGLSLPEHFVDYILSIVKESEAKELKYYLTELLKTVVNFTRRIKDRQQPCGSNLSGTYEEMYSNWRNKMDEAAKSEDVFSSFMNLASLQLMIDEIAEDLLIGQFQVMEQYEPCDLGKNVEVFDDALEHYLREYQAIGIKPKYFANVDEFVASYLQ